MNTNSPMPPSA